MDSITDNGQRTSFALRKIRLKGELGKRFGKIHRLAVKSPAEAIRALCALRPGFKEFLVNSEEHGIRYRFLIGREDIAPDDKTALQMARGEHVDFTLIPVVQGRKRNGLMQTLIGIVLIVASYYVPGAAGGLASVGAEGARNALAGGMFMMGTSLVLGGIAQMLSPMPKMDGPNEPGDSPSYLFSGAVNTVQQGQPVPLLYGRMRVGSAVIAAGLTNQDIPV